MYEKYLKRSMRLAEKTMKNTFHCQTADCPGWAVIEEDNVNVSVAQFVVKTIASPVRPFTKVPIVKNFRIESIKVPTRTKTPDGLKK